MSNQPVASEPLVVAGLGEALFDCFEERSLLGGAPVNFTVHMHRLLSQTGGRGVLVSRIGDDPLGQEVTTEVARRGVSTEWIQIDLERPTGRVNVAVDSDGSPTYDIQEEVAWDYLEYDEPSRELATKVDAVCFGSLAQRSPASRSAIRQFVDDASQAIRLFDVNLRQSFYDRDVIHQSFEAATIVKLNDEELLTVHNLLLDGSAQPGEQDACLKGLADAYRLDLIALTRGSEGTLLYRDGERVVGEPVQITREENADSVGAGDACCAGILYGVLHNWPLARTVELANALGGYVASQAGATPELPAEVLALASPTPG